MKYTLAINMAMTLDGKVMRPDGKWYGLSSRKDKARMDVYRSEVEILFLGKNSIQNDNPVIHLRYVDKEPPLPVVLIRRGSLDSSKRVFHTNQKPILYCTKINQKELIESLGDLAMIECMGENDLDVELVLQDLIKKGYTRFLLEGGPTLNSAFFQKNLVNKIYLTLVPYLIGQSNLLGILHQEFPFPQFDKKKWKLVKCEPIEDEVFLCYERMDLRE
jgi:riboflavin-specific deaminase-like protein